MRFIIDVGNIASSFEYSTRRLLLDPNEGGKPKLFSSLQNHSTVQHYAFCFSQLVFLTIRSFFSSNLNAGLKPLAVSDQLKTSAWRLARAITSPAVAEQVLDDALRIFTRDLFIRKLEPSYSKNTERCPITRLFALTMAKKRQSMGIVSHKAAALLYICRGIVAWEMNSLMEANIEYRHLFDFVRERRPTLFDKVRVIYTMGTLMAKDEELPPNCHWTGDEELTIDGNHVNLVDIRLSLESSILKAERCLKDLLGDFKSKPIHIASIKDIPSKTTEGYSFLTDERNVDLLDDMTEALRQTLTSKHWKLLTAFRTNNR